MPAARCAAKPQSAHMQAQRVPTHVRCHNDAPHARTQPPNESCAHLHTPPRGGQVVDFCRASGVGLVVVGPEAPLVAGLVDDLAAAGVRAFGPSAAAAQLEGSKKFMKVWRRRAAPASTRALW